MQPSDVQSNRTWNFPIGLTLGKSRDPQLRGGTNATAMPKSGCFELSANSLQAQSWKIDLFVLREFEARFPSLSTGFPQQTY
jgi:hypothetical protein